MMSYLILLVVVFFLGEKRQRIAPLKYDTYAQNALGAWLFFLHILYVFVLRRSLVFVVGQ